LHGHRDPISFADVIRLGFSGGFGVKISSGDVERFLEGVLMRRRSVQHRAFETDLIDGSWLWMTETVLEDGYFLSVATDISSLKRHEHVLTRARDSAMLESLTDALTGLPNRRAMLAEVEAAAEASRRSGKPLTVALLDLDHFKAINDRFGHDTGDRVLGYFAEYCTQKLAPMDRFGRLGGEEFLMMMPGLNAEHALVFVDWIRGRVPPVAAGEGGLRLEYSFSAGLAELEDGETMTQCLRRADEALYRAKSAGRNCVLVAEPGAVPGSRISTG
ncbi:MAG TPA: diguanylate cyclase, partial [Solimonas sp.]|nr:diguanylate cyclase [Solimonas sp.]